MNNYKEIEFKAGSSIDSALLQLKEVGVLACGKFNQSMIYSDIDDIDSAYKKVTGKTKSEFDDMKRKNYEESIRKEEEHKSKIPELKKEWIRKGCEVLDAKYIDSWIECVPVRLNDLYKGWELGCCLDIVKMLNNGESLQQAKELIDNQGHSGMSYSLVKLMVKEFCDRGKEFNEYLTN